jgi:transcriptional regulator with XRE-family HTH domain
MLAALSAPCQYVVMKLAAYIDEHDLTLEAFGDLCGRSAATISRLARGLHKPDWSTMEAIEKATGGKVQPNDWATSPPAPKRKRAA